MLLTLKQATQRHHLTPQLTSSNFSDLQSDGFAAEIAFKRVGAHRSNIFVFNRAQHLHRLRGAGLVGVLCESRLLIARLENVDAEDAGDNAIKIASFLERIVAFNILSKKPAPNLF